MYTIYFSKLSYSTPIEQTTYTNKMWLNVNGYKSTCSIAQIWSMIRNEGGNVGHNGSVEKHLFPSSRYIVNK